MLASKYAYQIKLVLFTVFVSLFFWLIFYLNIPGKIGFNNVNLETIYANYDGPNYMVISKCGYNKTCIGSHFSLPQSLEYYPAHFPAYPYLISLLNNFTIGPKAMLIATLLGSIFLSLISFELFKTITKEKKAFWLSLLLLFFPARLFILRQIGAPETWFLAATIASIFYFRKNKYLLSAIFAALAQTLKSPGVLLIFAYLVLAIIELIKTKNILNVIKKYLYYLLAPISLLLIFGIYRLQAGDFWAYFHSGDNFHLNPLPYLVFISNKSWINTIWLEDIIYIFLFSIYGVYRLIKKYKLDILAVYPLIFTLATLFVAHRDISRYIAPVYPFLFIAYKNQLNSKSLKLILYLLIPATLLFAINFVIGNTAPIADWTPYL